MRMRKVADLILDFELYPRNNVDSHNVTTIVNGLVVGDEIPPIVIDRKSKRVVDGFHRVKAYIKAFGEDAKIPVVEKSYKDDAALFMDAMRYNGTHGVKLDPCDRTHCVIVAERLGLSIDEVAGALRMPVEKLGSLRTGRTATTKAGLTVPLKNTAKHMHGQKLTEKQEETNQRLSGMNQVFYVNQVIMLIESDMLDTSDEGLMERLTVLGGLIDQLAAVK